MEVIALSKEIRRRAVKEGVSSELGCGEVMVNRYQCGYGKRSLKIARMLYEMRDEQEIERRYKGGKSNSLGWGVKTCGEMKAVALMVARLSLEESTPR